MHLRNFFTNDDDSCFDHLLKIGPQFSVGQIEASSFTRLTSNLGPPHLHHQREYEKYKHILPVYGIHVLNVVATVKREGDAFRTIKGLLILTSFVLLSLTCEDKKMSFHFLG